MLSLNELIGRIVFLLIRGSSTVERKGQWAYKTYHPRLLVRLLHFLAFGRWTHTYETEEGFELAFWRRVVLVRLLSESGLGVEVAEPLSLERNGAGWSLVTEWVDGEMSDAREIEDLQAKLEVLLKVVGLPTWSIARSNPRAYTNFIRRSRDGVLVIVDFESTILSFLVNDWVDFGKFRRSDVTGDLVRTRALLKLAMLQRKVKRSLRWHLSRKVF